MRQKKKKKFGFNRFIAVLPSSPSAGFYTEHHKSGKHSVQKKNHDNWYKWKNK